MLSIRMFLRRTYELHQLKNVCIDTHRNIFLESVGFKLGPPDDVKQMPILG